MISSYRAGTVALLGRSEASISREKARAHAATNDNGDSQRVCVCGLLDSSPLY